MNVTDFYYMRQPGLFASQYRDGVAHTQFDDGTSLEVTVESSIYEGQQDLRARIVGPGFDATIQFSDDTEYGLVVEAVLPYLQEAVAFAKQKADRRFIGPLWKKKNPHYHRLMARLLPYEVKSLKRQTI